MTISIDKPFGQAEPKPWASDQKITDMSKILPGDGPCSLIAKADYGTIRWCFDVAVGEAAKGKKSLRWTANLVNELGRSAPAMGLEARGPGAEIEATTTRVKGHLNWLKKNFAKKQKRCPVDLDDDEYFRYV